MPPSEEPEDTAKDSSVKSKREIDERSEYYSCLNRLIHVIGIFPDSKDGNHELKYKLGKIAYWYAVNENRQKISAEIAPLIRGMYMDWIEEATEHFKTGKLSKNFSQLISFDEFKVQLNEDGKNLPEEGDFENQWPIPSDVAQSSETELLSERSSEKNEWTSLI